MHIHLTRQKSFTPHAFHQLRLWRHSTASCNQFYDSLTNANKKVRQNNHVVVIDQSKLKSTCQSIQQKTKMPFTRSFKPASQMRFESTSIASSHKQLTLSCKTITVTTTNIRRCLTQHSQHILLNSFDQQSCMAMRAKICKKHTISL